MSVAVKQPIKMRIPAFGRPFSLGQLYDCRSDTVLAGGYLWDAEAISRAIKSYAINYSDHRVFEDKTIEDKMSALGIDENLLMSIQSGLIPSVGCSTYLADECSSKGRQKITLEYTCATRHDELNMEALKRERMNCPDVFVKGIGTHVVRGIRYGGKALFVFVNPICPNSKLDLMEAVQKLPTLKREGGEIHFSRELEEGTKDVICHVHTDLDISDHPTKYRNAAELFSTFSHSVVGSGNKPLPVEIELFPLEILDPLAARLMRPVDRTVTHSLGTKLSHLERVIKDCQGMLHLPILRKSPETERDLNEFLETLTSYKQLIGKQIQSVLIRYRSGSVKEDAFLAILEEKESSPFSEPRIEVWRKLRKVQIQILSRESDIIQRNGGGRQCNSERETYIVSINAKRDYDLTEAANAYLRSIQRGCLPKSPSGIKNFDLNSEVLTTKSFSNFVDANWSNSDLSFSFVKDTNVDEKPPVFVTVNKDGTTLHDTNSLPGAPCVPQLIEALHDCLQIECAVPDVRNNHVRQFEAEYRKSGGTGVDERMDRIHVEYEKNKSLLKISDLQIGTSYEIRVRSVCEFGYSAWSPTATFHTVPAKPPGQPIANYESPSVVSVQWPKPTQIAPNASIMGYIITVHNATTEEEFEVSVDAKKRERIRLCDLDAHSTYTFSVRAVFAEGQTNSSEKSADLTPTTTALMKRKIKGDSTPLESQNPDIHLLNIRRTHVREEEKNRKCEFGHAQLGSTEKVIMVVGATGAGKTTLINGLVNYVLGVSWRDKYRFQLIRDHDREEEDVSQADSQTRWITSYTLHHQEGFQVPYTLTVIDTPGFGDTGGIERDKEITTQIHNFFTTQGAGGIDHIDAIGFVTQASLARLTPTQKFIFDHVLSLFGKDISDNIFLLVTFADGQKPPVLEGVGKADIPYRKFFKFNNSALYSEKRESGTGQQTRHFVDDDDRERGFDEMFWEMGKKSFEKFFRSLNNTKPRSLLLTQDVLKEREHLETYMVGIQTHIRAGLTKLEALRRDVEELQKHETDIERNKEFTYTVEEDEVIKKDIPEGRYITNCLQCNFTCHYPCYIPDDSNKMHCAAMNSEKGICTVCPSHCVWNLHRNMTFMYIIKSVTRKKTSQDLKKRHTKATDEKMTAETMIENAMDEFDQVQLEVLRLTDDVRKTLNRLKDIALKPNPLSTVEYVDILINSEEVQKSPGWSNRVKQLNKVKEQASVLQELAQPGYDPFEEYKRRILDIKARKGEGETVLQLVRRRMRDFTGK